MGMSNIDRAEQLIGKVINDNLPSNPEAAGVDEAIAEALAEAGLIAPDLPEPDAWRNWDVNGLEVSAVDKDGEVLIEWEEKSDYAYYGTQTRSLWLNRDQVIAILAAANYAE